MAAPKVTPLAEYARKSRGERLWKQALKNRDRGEAVPGARPAAPGELPGNGGTADADSKGPGPREDPERDPDLHRSGRAPGGRLFGKADVVRMVPGVRRRPGDGSRRIWGRSSRKITPRRTLQKSSGISRTVVCRTVFLRFWTTREKRRSKRPARTAPGCTGPGRRWTSTGATIRWTMKRPFRRASWGSSPRWKRNSAKPRSSTTTPCGKSIFSKRWPSS